MIDKLNQNIICPFCKSTIQASYFNSNCPSCGESINGIFYNVFGMIVMDESFRLVPGFFDHISSVHSQIKNNIRKINSSHKPN